jgi:hypothetical protein
MNLACETVVREYGVKVVAAAGNTGAKGGFITSPANSGSTLAVGALNSQGEVASYSAKEYDVLAIGDIQVDIGGRIGARGTSFAAPAVSAMVSRWTTLHKDVSFRDINVRSSMTESADMFQGQSGEDLPVLKGGNMAETGASTKSTPVMHTLPYLGVVVVGFAVVFYGVRGKFNLNI